MLDHWLAPTTIATDDYPSYSWAGQLQPTPDALSQVPKRACALIGIHKESADLLRQTLYGMSWTSDGLKLYDLGNVRKNNADFLIPLLKELLESSILPILIGSVPTFVYAQFQALLQIRDHISLATVDERVGFRLDKRHASADDYLQKIVHQRRESLFQLNLIGLQTHFVDPQLRKYLQQTGYDYLRLGEARDNPEQAEPLLRHADLVSFQLSALKGCEAPAQRQPSPSGLFLEEACRLCRYAGFSDKLRGFSLAGFDHSAPKAQQYATAQAAAQLLWYLIDGIHARVGDYPATNKGLTEYIVDWKGHAKAKLTFWKSSRSERWWLQVPAKTPRKQARHRLIPCSYEDYKQTTQGDLPDRLWQAISRFG
jgi:formiminoglutamase